DDIERAIAACAPDARCQPYVIVVRIDLNLALGRIEAQPQGCIDKPLRIEAAGLRERFGEQLHLGISSGAPHADWPVCAEGLGECGLEATAALALERPKIAGRGQVAVTELRSDFAQLALRQRQACDRQPVRIKTSFGIKPIKAPRRTPDDG